MKKIPVLLGLVILVFSCNNNKKTPDVSGIRVDLTTERFEEDFYKLDSNRLAPGLGALYAKYPDFYGDFMQGILRVNGTPNDSPTVKMCRIMLGNYYSLYQAVRDHIRDFGPIEKSIQRGFRFVKYYFPQYKVPGIITFIGTLDAPGIITTDHYIAIGLHQYAGKDFTGYQSEQVRELYPAYISRRFEPEYIPANCMKAVVLDLFPDKSGSRSLIEQMVEKGKQWWLLDKFLPDTPDSLKTGYTGQQLDFCASNEGLIWSELSRGEDLNSVNPATIQTYIGEAPFTQGFSPELSPGNIGQWIGWQIVKKYAEKNPDLKPEQVMQTDPHKILEEAKYKPR